MSGPTPPPFTVTCDQGETCRAHMAAVAAQRCEYADQHPVIARDIGDLVRRVGDLESALRGSEGVYATLNDLKLQFATFTATVTASVRTTVALGSASGALLGALAAAAAVAAFFSRRG